MAAVRRTLEAVAPTAVPVLIQGESGTGKELCARFLHQLSSCRDGALVKVSCPAIREGLLETELFGHEKDAFTEAHATRSGKIEPLDGGTLLLDEVGSLEPALQNKLLQLLQDGTFLRVDGHDVRSLQARLIFLANRDLREQVREGTFRLDLLYRINAMTVQLPPLRQRMEDLPELTAFFLAQHEESFGTRAAPLSCRVLDSMARFHWPGNIRQLDHLMRSYVLIGREETLIDALLPERSMEREVLAEVDVSRPLALKTITRKATRELERQIILKVLQANAWNRLKTAGWLGISYRSLLYKLNEEGSAVVPRKRVLLMRMSPSGEMARVPEAGATSGSLTDV